MLVSLQKVPFRVRDSTDVFEMYDGDNLNIEWVKQRFSDLFDEKELEDYIDKLLMKNEHPFYRGVYLDELNLHANIESILVGSGFAYLDEYEPPYGVADNIEQVLAHFAQQVNDPYRTYIIGACTIRKSDQGEHGWRWHKWGPYIGTQTPTTEYLRDEPHINEVVVFHIYEVKVPDGFLG